MKTIKKYWCLYRENFGMTVLFQLIAFLVGMILVVIINKTVNEDPDFAPMGSFFAIFMAAILAVFRVDTSRMFLAVGMGQTRGRFLLWDTLFHVVQFLISILVCRLLYFIEIGICTRLYPGFENGMPLEVFFSLPVIGLLAVAVAGAGLLLLMLKVRFGQKAFVFVWISFWVLFMLGSRAISDAGEGKASVLAVMGKGLFQLIAVLPDFGWLLLGYGFAAVLAVIGVLGLHRVEIRQ